jgi:pachytene checkpoint protein 2
MSDDLLGVACRCSLPKDEFDTAWSSIKLAAGVRERLLSHALLSFTVRQKLPFELAPLHGVLLALPAQGRPHSRGGLPMRLRSTCRAQKPVTSKSIRTP